MIKVIRFNPNKESRMLDRMWRMLFDEVDTWPEERQKDFYELLAAMCRHHAATGRVEIPPKFRDRYS